MQGISEQLTPKLLKKQSDSELTTPPNLSEVNLPSNEVVEPRSPTNERNDLDDDLSSEANVDYTRLRDLLKAGKWKDANHETKKVMLKVVGRNDGDDIPLNQLPNFPCTDLRTIDSLWVKYSNGRFGFSVQKKIYLEVGGKPDGKNYEEAWNKLGDRVGWRFKQGSKVLWFGADGLTFDTTAPVGHLPDYVFPLGWHVLLFSRIETCQL